MWGKQANNHNNSQFNQEWLSSDLGSIFLDFIQPYSYSVHGFSDPPGFDGSPYNLQEKTQIPPLIVDSGDWNLSPERRKEFWLNWSLSQA